MKHEPRTITLQEIENGWLLTMDGQTWHYPSFILCLAQLKAEAVSETPRPEEGSFRKGGSQIEIEEYLRSKK